MRVKKEKTEDMNEAFEKFPHLKEYYDSLEEKPEWHTELNRGMKKIKSPNVLYPVGNPIFIHLSRKEIHILNYHVIEPKMDAETEELYKQVLDKLVERGDSLSLKKLKLEAKDVMEELYDKVVTTKPEPPKFLKKFDRKVHLNEYQYEVIKYFLIRDRIEYGILAPLFLDPYLEDIHSTGVGDVFTIHKIFEMVQTNIHFRDDVELNKYVSEVSERAGNPASDANSVVDSIMPDGSRVNFIYGRDVSLEGSSFTIRKFFDVPTSIIEIINYNTLSAQTAAYLWLALENGMNLFVCGETASGKTTTLNASVAFIKPEAKIYTCENTPEVKIPHDVWQHLSTREAGLEHDVTYQDLLIAALRSRPNYIIIGEIRGEEGLIAFQAMQTGHSVMSTFHAGDISMMIQRLIGKPILVPITSVNNLNIVLFQMAVTNKGQHLRRVLEVVEIERYYEPENKMVTRTVFKWDPRTDSHIFLGMNNSFILEDKIAKAVGYLDPRKIYDDLKQREMILTELRNRKIFDYYQIWDIVKKFRKGGVKSLPFEMKFN